MVAPFAALALPLPAAAQTMAGTPIVNVAALRAEALGIPSNTVTLLVAERLDCTLTRGSASVGAVLTNTGNGNEAFVVAATIGADATPRPIAIDDDGDGRFDPAHDYLLTDGITPVLAPGASLHLLVPIDDGAAPSVTIAVRAATGSGTPGTLLAGLGDGGSDAVVGSTGAAARLVIALAADTPPIIIETQTVLAGDGSAAPRPGAIVTYTLTARFIAASPAASLVDPVPVNTDYRPASLVLDDTAIPDAGHVADRRITVPLGAVEAGSVHRLIFQVVIP